MHISSLNEVAKLNAALSQVRGQIQAIDTTSLTVSALNGAHLDLSEATIETFTKLALIELAEKEAKIIGDLEDLGVDADPVPFEDSVEAPVDLTAKGAALGELIALGLLLGGGRVPGFHAGGVVGGRSPFPGL